MFFPGAAIQGSSIVRYANQLGMTGFPRFSMPLSLAACFPLAGVEVTGILASTQAAAWFNVVALTGF
jgi:hypothetical protein